MDVEKTKLDGVFILTPIIYYDDRGFFMESYHKDRLNQIGLDTHFTQDNHSYSKKKGTLRGIHFQNNPKAQTKLVRCVTGKILDVIVDLRKNSPTYKEWISLVLSYENNKQVFIPKGFGHGFLTLTDDVHVVYKVDEYYDKDLDRSIYYDDEALQIRWNIRNPIVSKKDRFAPRLETCDINL